MKQWKKIAADIIILHKCETLTIWDTVPKIQSETEFIVILGLFCPFTPATAQKLKMKTLGDIISQKYTKNHDHRLHCSWYMACDGCNYFSFRAMFCPFTPLTAPKMKISKKWKEHLKISSFNAGLPKIMFFTVPEIWPMTDVTIFHFGLFFALLPHNSPKHKKFKKMKKTPGDIIILYNCTKNNDHMLYCSWDMAHDGCN